MANELIKTEQSLQAIEKFGLGNVIKPLLKEVFLDDVIVHGVLLHGDILREIKVGDELTLKRERKPYDDLYVAVYFKDKRIGELPELEEEIYARLLDAGKKLTAKAKYVVILPEYSALEISISLIDF